MGKGHYTRDLAGTHSVHADGLGNVVEEPEGITRPEQPAKTELTGTHLVRVHGEGDLATFSKKA